MTHVGKSAFVLCEGPRQAAAFAVSSFGRCMRVSLTHATAMQISVTRDAATGVVLQFTRTFDDLFTGVGDQNLLLAASSGQALSYHASREGVTVSLQA